MLPKGPLAGFETPVGRLEDLSEPKVELTLGQLLPLVVTDRLTAMVVTNIASTMPYDLV